MKQSSPGNSPTHSHGEEKCASIIQNKRLTQGHIIDITVYDGKMIFILNGSVSISYETIKDHTLSLGEVVFIPPSCHLIIIANRDSEFIILRTTENIYFCNGIPLEILYKKMIDRKNNLHLLKGKPAILHFFKTFQMTIDTQIESEDYLRLKVRELFYLLMKNYSTTELTQFLSPILSSNSSFLYFIYKNYNKVKTAQELASLFGNSLSAFEKQFHKAFGTPVYQWMLQKKTRKIYHELKCSNQSLREIASNYNFSSHTQFNDFCKKHLGDTPGKLREFS